MGGGKDKDRFCMDHPIYQEPIPCEIVSATRADETLAHTKGYQADIVIRIQACCYSGLRELIEDSSGTEYDVKRAYQKGDKMELTCEKRRQYGEV